jgi:general secretion pathway protein G
MVTRLSIRRPKHADPLSLIPDPCSGLTLIELILVITIIGILSIAAVPVVSFQIKRTKEKVLRRDLWSMRAAIDNYKDAADKNAFQTKVDSGGYPPDLQTLVDGVTAGTQTVRFLRAIPVDPMTGKADWATRAMQDDPDSDGSGDNVFDVHSKSDATAIDGTKYSTW